MDKEVIEKILKITEEFYGSEADPEQMPVTQESVDKLLSVSPDTIFYKLDESGNPIAWGVVVPTSTATMEQFVNKEISEKELLDRAMAEKRCEALYLCSAFVVPEERGKGHAKSLLLEAIAKNSHGKDIPMYCWVYSEEGRMLVESLERELGRTITPRKK